MNKIIYFIFTIIALVGCNKGKIVDVLPVLDMENAINGNTSKSFVWNDIAKDIEYVPISTFHDSLLGTAQLVDETDDSYFIVDHKTFSIIKTDKKGNIRMVLNKRGQGPEEYNMLSYVHVNQSDSTIWIIDQRGDKCLIYSTKGQFKKSFSLKNKKVGIPIFMSDEFSVAKAREDSDHKLYVTNENFEIKYPAFRTDTTATDIERLCLMWQLNYCRNRDFPIINYANEDTVFVINNFKITPICILKKGIYNLPLSEAKKAMSLGKSPYIRTVWLSIFSKYCLISYLLNGVFYDEIWDLSNNQILSRLSNTDGQLGLPIKLPSGKLIRLNSRSLYIKGNTVATSIDAATAVEGGILNVNEDDNPVLVFIRI